MSQEVAEIISNARQQLEFIKTAVDLMSKNSKNIPVVKRELANVLVFGRSVTFVVQNLRSKVGKEQFNEWYEPIQEKMKGDRMLNAFKDARNRLEKQGKLGATSSLYIRNLNPQMMQRMMSNPPKNAKGFFIGDQFGGSGWEVEMPDGTIKKHYVNTEFADFDLKAFFISSPSRHDGKELIDTSIPNCCNLYYLYLKNIVDEAHQKFNN